MSTASNLAVSIIAGVAVMFIWQQIQKAQAKAANVNSGSVKGGQTFSISDLYAPDWARGGTGGSMRMPTSDVFDLLDNKNRVYSV